MILRTRLVLTIGLLLLVTVLGGWLIAAGLFLRPLAAALALERADTALYLARELEYSADPGARARELSNDLGVEILPSTRASLLGEKLHHLRRGGRDISIVQGRHTTVYVPLDAVYGVEGMAVSFPVDLTRPARRVGRGFVLLGLGVLLVSALLVNWMLRPLVVTSRAMEQVAAGALDHRLPEGHDLTGRMGATFNHMATRLEALVQGQRRLMAAVSHELRTPLTRMRLATEMLRDDGANEQRLSGIEEDLAEIDALVEELLESARLDEGVVALNKERAPVGRLLEQAVAAVDIGDRSLTMRLEPGLELYADGPRMGRVFTNLLSNIAHYTPRDTHILIDARRRGSGVAIRVEDSGPGVSQEELEHLFEPFYRAEDSRCRRTGGLGLGLMLVRQIVDAHGGRVQAENLQPSGLAMDIYLPDMTAPTPRG